MSFIDQDLQHRPRRQRSPSVGFWRGTIASTPPAETATVDVIIPEFDDTHTFGPCRWSPRIEPDPDNPGSFRMRLPARGDICLLVFSNRKDPWIIEWWPYS